MCWFRAVRSEGIVMSVNRFLKEAAWNAISNRLDIEEAGADPWPLTSVGRLGLSD